MYWDDKEIDSSSDNGGVGWDESGLVLSTEGDSETIWEWGEMELCTSGRGSIYWDRDGKPCGD